MKVLISIMHYGCLDIDTHANQFLPHGIICAFPQKLKNHYDCSYLNDPISWHVALKQFAMWHVNWI